MKIHTRLLPLDFKISFRLMFRRVFSETYSAAAFKRTHILEFLQTTLPVLLEDILQGLGLKIFVMHIPSDGLIRLDWPLACFSLSPDLNQLRLYSLGRFNTSTLHHCLKYVVSLDDV